VLHFAHSPPPSLSCDSGRPRLGCGPPRAQGVGGHLRAPVACEHALEVHGGGASATESRRPRSTRHWNTAGCATWSACRRWRAGAADRGSGHSASGPTELRAPGPLPGWIIPSIPRWWTGRRAR